MKIGTATPTKTRTRLDWKPLVNAVSTAAPNTWLSLLLADLPGTSSAQKQTHVHNAMSRNNLQCRTQTEEDVLFVQRVEPSK
jgi:hypothetical protein